MYDEPQTDVIPWLYQGFHRICVSVLIEGNRFAAIWMTHLAFKVLIERLQSVVIFILKVDVIPTPHESLINRQFRQNATTCNRINKEAHACDVFKTKENERLTNVQQNYEVQVL